MGGGGGPRDVRGGGPSRRPTGHGGVWLRREQLRLPWPGKVRRGRSAPAEAMPLLAFEPVPLAARAQVQAEKEQQGFANDDEFGRWWSNPASAAAGDGGGGGGGGVGRYLSAAPRAGGAAAAGAAGSTATAPTAKKAKTTPGSGYGNFDAW